MYFSNNGADSGLRIVDVNGDGLPDLIYGWGDSDANAHYDAWLNNGHGWTEDTAWDPPTTFVNSILPSDPGVRIADVNGDGLPDLLQGWNVRRRISSRHSQCVIGCNLFIALLASVFHRRPLPVALGHLAYERLVAEHKAGCR